MSNETTPTAAEAFTDPWFAEMESMESTEAAALQAAQNTFGQPPQQQLQKWAKWFTEVCSTRDLIRVCGFDIADIPIMTDVEALAAVEKIKDYGDIR